MSQRGKTFFTSLDDLKRSTLHISNANNMLWSLGAYGSEDWTSHYFTVTKSDIIKGRYNGIQAYEHRSIYDVISLLLLFGSASTTESIWSKLAESNQKIMYYPYNDNDLLNYIFSVAWDTKLHSHKNILRFVAQKLDIPDFIINRPKRSFGLRSELWSEKGGVFEPLIPLVSKVFNEKGIRKVQSSSDPKKAMIFWNILNYSIWRRLCINNEPLEILLEELE